MDGCVPRMRVCTGGKDAFIVGELFAWAMVELAAVADAVVACA